MAKARVSYEDPGRIYVEVDDMNVPVKITWVGTKATSVNIDDTERRCSNAPYMTMFEKGSGKHTLVSKYTADKMCGEADGAVPFTSPVLHGLSNDILYAIYSMGTYGIIIQMENVFEAAGAAFPDTAV